MEEKKITSEKTFQKNLVHIMWPQNIVLSLISVFYIFYFTDLPYNSLVNNAGSRLAIMIGAIIIIMQFFLMPLSTRFLIGDISSDIRKDEADELSIMERTSLVRNIMRLPLKISIAVCISFAISAILFTAIINFFFRLDLLVMLFFFACGIFCSYIALLASFSYTETLCSKYSIALTKKGIDFDTVSKDKFYGPSLLTRMILFIDILVILASGAIFFIAIESFQTNYHQNNVFAFSQAQFTKINIMISVNFITTILYSYIAFWQLSNSYKSISKVLENILSNIEEKNLSLETDLSNDFSHCYFLTNNIINYLHTIIDDAFRTSQNILSTTENLFVMAEEASATASNENDNVNRCLFSIDALTDILSQISENLYTISSVSADAKIDIDEGYEILHTEIIENKMHEIASANIRTILDIKKFSEKIDNIWNIVKDIDKITEKTKIIAFNAELGATESAENGESFHIIASEIRRLALTVAESSHKLKEYIHSIQEFSDSLIVTSEVGTQKIREGSKFFSELESDFTDLRTAIDISAESAISTQQHSNAQDSVFTQIKDSFSQISTGFNQFAETAQYINSIAEKLREIAGRIRTIEVFREEQQ